VFGASNFPLAFSVAGGDTASALAAGCPVVVKGHSAHPGTGEIVAQAIEAAIKDQQCPSWRLLAHPGWQQRGGRSAGAASAYPCCRLHRFAGWRQGAFQPLRARPDPIPFFGELGSVNPMFVLPSAIANRTEQIASGWAGSLTMGAGQFCTNPGIAILIDGPDADAFIAATRQALEPLQAQTMLTDGMAQAYVEGRATIANADGVTEILSKSCPGRQANADLYVVSGDNWLANHALAEEVFGPLGLVVRAKDTDQMIAIAQSLKGQLTATLHMDDADAVVAQSLMPILTRKAGRILANGYPTGVEVADAMVHGGPYPASTNFGATSVGTLSIRRWLRPVCFQAMPTNLLPGDLR
jgi:alpha-ketoglutaric semialdehyde dehydrogenase